MGDVVGDLGADGDAGDGALEGGAGVVEGGGADVDGLVEDGGLEAGEGAEEEAGLGGGAGAELGEGDGVRLRRGAKMVVGVGGEEDALGAGEVVLGEGGDLLEEAGAGGVVEEPGREGFGVAVRPSRAATATAWLAGRESGAWAGVRAGLAGWAGGLDGRLGGDAELGG